MRILVIVTSVITTDSLQVYNAMLKFTLTVLFSRFLGLLISRSSSCVIVTTSSAVGLSVVVDMFVNVCPTAPASYTQKTIGIKVAQCTVNMHAYILQSCGNVYITEQYSGTSVIRHSL